MLMFLVFIVMSYAVDSDQPGQIEIKSGGGGGAENSIQLSPEGEVNSGGCIPRRKALRYISTALHPPWGNYSCFSIYQIRWIKKCCFN